MSVEIEAKSPGIIRVLSGINPVFASNKATVIEFRDKFGDLMALFFKQYGEDIWVFSTQGDDDWESDLIRLGYLSPGLSAEQLAVSAGVKR